MKHAPTLQAGDLVNTPGGTGLVVGFLGDRALVAPTGQDPPYSTHLAYCEAWRIEHLTRRGWRNPPMQNEP